MKYKFKIPVGDPSGDGHSQCERVIIESNKSPEEIKEAYNKSCELTGLVFTENKDIVVNGEKLDWQHPERDKRRICVEYESYESSDLAQDILKEYGIENPVINGDIDSLVDIFLNFIKLSLPDFEYKFIQDNIPSLGLTIGYGLFN